MASVGSRPRVLIVVQNLPVPFDRRVWLEATTLHRAGYQVSVICPKGRSASKSYEHLDGVHIHRYPIPIEAKGLVGYVFEFTWAFARTTLKSFRIALGGPGFDVIHACNPPDTYWLLGRFWKLFGKRFLFDHHDLSPEMYAAKYDEPSPRLIQHLRRLERAAFRTADVVITTNESHRQVAMGRGGVPEDRVFVVRSGPALERLRRYPANADWNRGARHLLVYLGEMCEQDGVDYLVRSLRILRDDHGRDDVHCVFVGGGPHQPAIARYAHEQGVGALTTFTGRVSDEDLCRILSSADVAVDPDPKNEWSDKSTMNKIMEYMFFGLPIVCFDLAEHRVSAGEAALYARPNRETDLAAQIDVLLRDPERRRRLGSIGTERLETQLAWEYSVPNLLAAYQTLFNGSR